MKNNPNPGQSVLIATVDLSPCILGQDDPDWRYSGAAFPSVDGWLVKITSQRGHVGYGHIEAMPAVSDTMDGAKAAADFLATFLLEQNPLDTGQILDRLDQALAGHTHVKSGFDCALHDLKAQILGVPLHQLFGGAGSFRLEMSRIIPLKEPEVVADCAQALVDQGYRNLKVKLSGEAGEDLARIKRIRSAVGGQIRISVDPNQSYSMRGAILTLRQLAKLGVKLVEQPVDASNLAGLREVRENVDMLVEADEAVRGPRQAMRVIAQRAADSINLKLGEVGGLRNAKIIADMCHAAGLGCRMGAAFGPQLLSAQAAQFAATLKAHFYPHELAEFEHFNGDPTCGLRVENGMLDVPNQIGSGVKFINTSRGLYV